MGPLVTAVEIRKATQDRLEEWLPAYLAELGRRYERDLPPPRTWRRLPDFRALTDDQSPALVVTSPGLVTEADRDGDGEYSATWQVNVFLAVRGQTFEETADLVGLYTAAVRACLGQQGIDIANARRPRWRGEGYNELAAGKARTIGGGMVSFAVHVGAVLDEYAGPSILPDPPEYKFVDVDPAEEVNISVDRLDD